jgi:hypothetical protein
VETLPNRPARWRNRPARWRDAPRCRSGFSDLSSGIYVLRLQAGDTTTTQKITVVR